MVVDPGTAMLISSAISAAAQGGGSMLANQAQKRAQKKVAKESRRETRAGMLQDTLQRGAELEGQRLEGRKRLAKSKVKSHMETADIVRGALDI